ncbi:16S rRNA (guanine(966)-N(2))-methyltransferase RsmD [Desulfogranum japonicum]|uniref:16S rRNA (guanine(966)-N(2))-methyltransferase RsmD n=1 Tax=Desulfogranum japonicum TaxID=231447 RepID=UPI000A038E18|nr:16S rRNA (guanine(966)-N(2))-methyltransferase RsmD [Desulfogranum japonicum]
MRITGGQCRGRKLATPKNLSHIRPTSDRVREAIFNIVGSKVEGAGVLDCFAGTGALGIEALSRGADFAIFIDQSRKSLELITQNLLTCFKQPRAKCIQHSLNDKIKVKSLCKHLPPGISFDLIFMDPPYGMELVLPALSLIEQGNLLADKGIILVEEHREVQLPATTSQMRLVDQRVYGETGIWLYTAVASINNYAYRKPQEP